jgi:hypothetical protein
MPSLERDLGSYVPAAKRDVFPGVTNGPAQSLRKTKVILWMRCTWAGSTRGPAGRIDCPASSAVCIVERRNTISRTNLGRARQAI